LGSIPQSILEDLVEERAAAQAEALGRAGAIAPLRGERRDELGALQILDATPDALRRDRDGREGRRQVLPEHVAAVRHVAWGQPDPTPYWAGAYDATSNPGGVDVISMDFYQANISQYHNGGKQSAWSLAQSGATIDLDWMVTYAQKNGVKIALSEYGAGSSSSNGETSGAGLDDGTWTAASIAWMNAQPPGFFLWTAWSDDAPADDIVTAKANPAEQAAWSAAWKGTHFAGAWWAGTPPP
jgi:hypothetical protein